MRELGLVKEAMDLQDKPSLRRGRVGKNPVRSRDYNRRVVLDLLRQTRVLQRKDLAQALQLSSPAVGNILEDLLAEGLILDMGRLSAEAGKQGRGQPPLQFSLNPQGAHTLGFEIGPRGVVAVMLDLIGTPISREVLATEALSLEDGLAVMQREIHRAAAMQAGPLLGIGVVRPGAIAGEDPTSLRDWDQITAAQMSARLGHPVWLENDANAAALSEALFGAGAHLQDLAVLYFGHGVGLGALVGGKLMRGARGHAGEIGHIAVVPNGKLCSCGQRGCFERYVSRHALSEALGRTLSPGTVAQLWQEQDPGLLAWITQSGQYLSLMIGLVENLLDPQGIILSGQLPAPVMQAMIASVQLRPSVAVYSDRETPRLQCGQAGAFTAAMGAAALPFYDAMSPQDS